ncbi:hypothetical protein ABM016_14630 [Morganella morganii]|uniref:hypothetical protein n=1 Tax=Morganella morganii TaxID=582 RepID=UPI003EBA6924
MDREYYFKNLLFSFLILLIHLIYAWTESDLLSLLTAFFVINAVLFPFAKFIIESVILIFFRKKDWSVKKYSGTMESKAFYHFMCFVFSIPLCFFYILFFILKLMNSPRKKDK